MKYIHYLYATLCIALLACSNGEVGVYDPDQTALGGRIMAGAGTRAAAGEDWNIGPSQEEQAPAGVEVNMNGGPIASQWPQSIGVYALRAGSEQPVFDDQPMYYFNHRNATAADDAACNFTTGYINSWVPTTVNNWVYAPVEYWQLDTYKFIAYSPYTPSATSFSDIAADGYHRFTWAPLPRFATVDHMAARALDMYDNTDRRDGYTDHSHTVLDLPRVTLMHLMSRVRMCFKLGTKYNQVRMIYLKDVQIDDALQSHYRYTSLYRQDGQYERSILRAVEGETPEAVNLNLEPEFVPADDDPRQGLRLTTRYQPFGSLYVLTAGTELLDELHLTITYDVYDLDGYLTRQDCQTSCRLTPTWSVQSGYYYNVRIIVEPDFLYVLSDDDFDQDYDGYIDI